MMTPQIPTQEGQIHFRIPGRSDLSCFTYFKVFGDLSGSGVPPLVLLHGGPGAGHETHLNFAELWPKYGIPCIFYDQIGCGASTRLPETAGDHALWNVALFIAELENLLDHFNLRRPDSPGYHLFGHSWGANLASDFATSQPVGLQRLILASGLASRTLARQGYELLRQEGVPPEMVRMMKECEQREDLDGPAYKEALMIFMRKYLCREWPFPPELMTSIRNLSEDKTVQGTMNGPSPFVINGSTKDWTVIPRLPLITAETLVYNGEYDTSHDIATMPFFELIPRVRWITFAGGSHMCHVEGGGLREKVFRAVGDFLTQGSKMIAEAG